MSKFGRASKISQALTKAKSYIYIYIYIYRRYNSGQRLNSQNRNSKFTHYIKYMSNWRKAGYTATVLLALTIMAILFPISFKSADNLAEAAAGTAQDSSITLTFTSDTASVSLNLTDTAGSTATSSTTQDNDERAKFTITTNNVSGYELKIKASNNTNLSNGTDTIPAIGTAGIALSSFATNSWGYMPNYYNSTANSNNLYYPITTSDVTLDKPTSATTREYIISLGLKADYTKSAGTYTNTANGNTILLSYVANPVSYTINYDKGNATGTVDNLPATQNNTTSETSVTLSSTVPTWSGYDFKGWCFGTLTDLNSCSGTVYNPDGGGTNLTFGIDKTTTNTVTLHAMWQKVQYTISYNANSGSGSISSQTIDAGSSVTLKDNGFTRTNYYFMGWSTSSTATSPTYRTNQSITPTGNMTLYAVWGSSTNTRLYNAVASLTRGNQTNDNNATTGIQASITKANSGVYTYNATTFGTASDASTSNSIYYYRGILDATTSTYGSDGDSMDYPNYVILDANGTKDTSDTCWRIVRTTGSGGVKMIYNGKWTGSTCANAKTNAQVTTQAFGLQGNSAQSTYWYRNINRVGYTFNNTQSLQDSTTATDVDTVFGSDASPSTNNERSNIKKYIEDTWYASNMTSWTSKLEASAGYCNDRTAFSNNTGATALTTIPPYATSSADMYFGAYARNMNSAKTPSLTCPRSTVDLYRYVSGSTGVSNQLKYPVALLTADEASFAGSGSSTASNGSGYNANSYLRSGSNFWLLSPSYRSWNGNAYGFFLFSPGPLDYNFVNNTYGVRPAISLLPGTKIASGSGTATSPWEVIPPTTVTVSNTNTTSSVDSLSIPYGESATVTVTPASGYYLSGVTCPSGYTCTGYNTGSSYTGAQTVTITNNNTTSDGTLTLTGKSSKLYMWNATSANCGTTMYDNRDGTERAYTTAKIGSLCWMTQNLMLGASSSVTLYKATTNITANTYTLPARGTYGTSTSGQYVWGNNTQCTSSSTTACAGYYSYAAATAGTNPSSGAASSDICPAGWRLPTQAELTTLKNSYTTGATLTKSPFFGVYSGNYNSSSFYQGGSGGFYWSSTAYGSEYAHRLYFYASSADVTNSSYKLYGYAIRCVAKS